MKIKKKPAEIIILVLISFAKLYGTELPSTSALLISYLENDNDLKKNAIAAEKARLSLSSTKIDNGFDISLSTGNVTIKTDSKGTSFSVKPAIQAKLPQASNLTLSASTAYNYMEDTSKIENTQIKLSADIISSTGLARQVALLKAERNLTEATRKLRNQAIITEISFYTELKSLLNSTNTLLSLEKTLYTNQIDFEKVKAQGYSSGSSTYRLAQMKVISSEHDIENSKRSLINSYVLFYKKCGFDISFDDKSNFTDLIPADITGIEPIDVHDFDSSLYSEVESVLWTNKINSMQRKTKSNFSLGANGGITFNNTAASVNTVDAGLSSGVGGFKLDAGVSLPVNDLTSPVFTLSASLSPNTFRQNSITKQTDELSEKEEQVNLETAYANYETKVFACEQELEKILWNTKSDEESYQMYAALEQDLAKWFQQGIITESEYYTARVNAQSYYVKNIINTIDLIIYNDNIVTMFVEGEN